MCCVCVQVPVDCTTDLIVTFGCCFWYEAMIFFIHAWMPGTS